MYFQMDKCYILLSFYYRLISVDEVLTIWEENEENAVTAEENFPPNNATADLIDEDSGDEFHWLIILL